MAKIFKTRADIVIAIIAILAALIGFVMMVISGLFVILADQNAGVPYIFVGLGLMLAGMSVAFMHYWIRNKKWSTRD